MVAGMTICLHLDCKSFPIAILVTWHLHTQLVAEEEQEIRSSPRYRHTSDSIQLVGAADRLALSTPHSLENYTHNTHMYIYTHVMCFTCFHLMYRGIAVKHLTRSKNSDVLLSAMVKQPHRDKTINIRRQSHRPNSNRAYEVASDFMCGVEKTSLSQWHPENLLVCPGTWPGVFQFCCRVNTMPPVLKKSVLIHLR